MRIPRLRSPIVLVHGFFGFDRVEVCGLSLANYWPGIADCLKRPGNRVLLARLSPTAGVVERAVQLKNFLDRESPREPVHLLAHSMGGLDARYMISRLGMAERVLSLTTLGTPHRGTSFADWGINRLERIVKPVLRLFGVPTEGFYDLTIKNCRRFNAEVPDASGVRYFSVAGRHEGWNLNPEFLLPYGIVYEAEGPNDGIVSLTSAGWGESVDIWDGDHFSLVNWFNPLAKYRGLRRDPAPRYGPLVRRLADLGF